MITVRLKGGLGNQMFQYAFGRAIAQRNGDDLALDLTYLLDRRPGASIVFRDYDLGMFPVRASFTRLSRLALRAPVPYAWLGASEAWQRARAALGAQQYLREEAGFDPATLPRVGDLFLDGYWQDERFFAKVADEVRETFRSVPPLSPSSQALLHEIETSASVSVNVRRTDFVHHPGSAKAHGFVGLDYYDRAMRLVEDRVAAPRLYVFSDEPEWCHENLHFEHPTTYVGHEHAGDRFGTYLALMSACRHFVIPNSSFGWWAAWLAPHAGKTIVAPARWSAASELLADPVPDGWLRA